MREERRRVLVAIGTLRVPGSGVRSTSSAPRSRSRPNRPFIDCRRTQNGARCGCSAIATHRGRRRHDSRLRPASNRSGRFDGCFGSDGESVTRRRGALAAGVPESLAQRSAIWKVLHTGFDVIEIAQREGVPLAAATTAYWQVFNRLDLMWLWDAIGALPRADRWQTQARSALRDDLMTVLAELAGTVIRRSGGSTDSWIAANERPLARALEMFAEIRRAEAFDLTNLSVALRQLRNLGLTSVHER